MSIEKDHKKDVAKTLGISGLLSLGRKAIIGYWYSIKYQDPKIMSRMDTLNYIIEHHCSVARFGDGEMRIALGEDVACQKNSPELTRRMMESMTNLSDENILVCFPDILQNKLQRQKVFDNTFYRYRYFYDCRKAWDEVIDKNYLYGSANLSRLYIAFKDKEHSAECFKRIKDIWRDRDVLLVEGEKSRQGVGNDLFDDVKSMKRILCPAAQCFDRYDDIFNEIKKLPTDVLILLANGPSAKMLVRDLTALGYQAIDIGSIDAEYEWFLAGTRERIAIEGKFFYEAQNSTEVGEYNDEKYLSQIVAKIL